MEPNFVFSLYLMIFITPWLLLTFHGNAITSTYIVHMNKTFFPQIFTTHHDWFKSTIHSLKSKTVVLDEHDQNQQSKQSQKLVYTYDHAMYGFSAILSSNELETLKNIDGFVAAYQDRNATIDTTHTYEFLSLDSQNGLWNTSNLGEDIIIGVIDSGLWPESQSFKDDGMTKKIPNKWKGTCEDGQEFNASMCNFKLIGARYFNKGLIASKPNVTISMNSARDILGHGTHTSSTVAGNYVNEASYFGYAKGTARGIAPRARLAIYKVVWEEGRLASDVLAAIDLAIVDGVDVISISMGFDGVPLHEDPIAIASFAAMEKGIVVSSSAGNSGPKLRTLHNGIPWLITVAAGTVDRTFGTLVLGNGKNIIGWTLFATNDTIVENLPLVYSNTLSSCNSVKLLSQLNKQVIIVCNSNLNSVFEQIEVVKETNVLGAIFVSDNPDLIEFGRLYSPSIVIKPKEAKYVINYAQTHNNPIASIKFQQTFIGIKPAPVAAHYSSRGPSKSHPWILKPDIMAPGSRVLAAYPPKKASTRISTNKYLFSDYNFMSGTSMACPHVSGVAALLKAKYPQWSSAAIRSALVTTANPFDNTNSPIRDNGYPSQYASPFAIGAGEIDPNRAMNPGLIYDATPQDYVNLLCGLKLTEKQILTITRNSSYDCGNSSLDLNYPSFIAFYSNETKSVVKKFERTVTNVGDGAVTYRSKVMHPRGCVVTVSPNILDFSYRNEKLSYYLSIKYVIYQMENVSFGDIVWIEDGGTHTVRSPIVVAPSGIV